MQGKLGAWDVLGSYTLGFSRGTVGDYFDNFGDNPRFMAFQEGPTPDDTRHTFKGVVNYEPVRGLNLGMKFQYRTGTPLWMYQFGSTDNPRIVHSERGTGHAIGTTGTPNFSDPTTISEFRNPSIFLMDASVRYDLGQAVNMGKNRAEIGFLLFNILNNTDPTFFVEEYSTTNTRFGTVSSRRGPFQAELVLRVRN
jgi:hypothetical protein